MSPLRAQLRLWGRSKAEAKAQRGCMVGGAEGQAPLADRGHAAGSADGKVGGLVDKMSYLYKIEEDGGVNGARARGVVVCIRNGLEDFGGQLEPWSVER